MSSSLKDHNHQPGGFHAYSSCKSGPNHSVVTILFACIFSKQSFGGFNIKAEILNRGPSGLPHGKVLVFVQVPDSLSSMEVISSNRMDECGSFLNGISKVRQAYCSIKSLGPGVPNKASYTIRVLPGESSFYSGGKFTAIVYIFALTQDGLIRVDGIQRQITVTVKGKKISQPSCDLCPTNCSCFRRCWYSDHNLTEWNDWDWTRYCWRICNCGFK